MSMVYAMSILQYFKKDNHSTVCLPDNRGFLSRSLPSDAIQSANTEVGRCVAMSVQLACQCDTYTPSQMATIGRFVVENGVLWQVKEHSQLNCQ